MLKIAYIAFGSNLGDKNKHCSDAIQMIKNLPGCKIEEQSPFFSTAPVGMKDQDWFVNGVISVKTGLSPHKLISQLHEIETKLGRVRVQKWGPRVIDLDIIFFGKEVIHKNGLIIPHPLMHLRKFVLVPMTKISPDLIHPLLGQTMVELLKGLENDDQAIFSI